MVKMLKIEEFDENSKNGQSAAKFYPANFIRKQRYGDYLQDHITKW